MQKSDLICNEDAESSASLLRIFCTPTEDSKFLISLLKRHEGLFCGQVIKLSAKLIAYLYYSPLKRQKLGTLYLRYAVSIELFAILIALKRVLVYIQISF